jgi:hypothetical protein
LSAIKSERQCRHSNQFKIRQGRLSIFWRDRILFSENER